MFKRDRILLLFAHARHLPPAPPIPNIYYTDRLGRIYTDRNGDPYRPRIPAPYNGYTDRNGLAYTDRNGNPYRARFINLKKRGA